MRYPIGVCCYDREGYEGFILRTGLKSCAGRIAPIEKVPNLTILTLGLVQFFGAGHSCFRNVCCGTARGGRSLPSAVRIGNK
jgi:hypothetical protein